MNLPLWYLNTTAFEYVKIVAAFPISPLILGFACQTIFIEGSPIDCPGLGSIFIDSSVPFSLSSIAPKNIITCLYLRVMLGFVTRNNLANGLKPKRFSFSSKKCADQCKYYYY